jgi:diaminopimelate decarboxylase
VNLLETIAESVGTPFYAYDAGVFRARIRAFENALAGVDHLTCYSLKANDALALVRIAGEEELGADVVSGGELFKARRAGIAPERIVFSGVGKRGDEIRAALEDSVRSINVESHGELDLVAAEARGLGVRAPVAVRLNPDVDPDTHAYIATGRASSKFGLPSQTVLEELRRTASDPALEPVGISFHVGSQLLDPTPVFTAAERAAALWRDLEHEGLHLRDFDVGGGLGIPYESEGEPDVAAYASALAGIASGLGATLVLEPGRFLVAPAGTFVTRVLYVKDVPGRRVAVCDGGMNDLLRPSLYGAHHPVSVLGATDARPRGLVDVVGPVCETGDFFALDRELPLPAPGDLVAIGYAGAYGRVMSSTYNARPLCAEALVDGGRWRVIRERGTYEDLLRGEGL